MTKQFDTIRGFPIILSADFPKPAGGRSGSLILVDHEDQYVVSCRYNDEATGEPQDEWGQGNYFPFNQYVKTPKSRALAEALDLYRDKLARIRGNDAAA